MNDMSLTLRLTTNLNARAHSQTNVAHKQRMVVIEEPTAEIGGKPAVDTDR